MANQMQIILKKLGSLGYQKTWLQKNVMPNWWDDKLAQNPVNRKIAKLTLSKFFGIPLEKLRDEEITLERDSFDETTLNVLEKTLGLDIFEKENFFFGDNDKIAKLIYFKLLGEAEKVLNFSKQDFKILSTLEPQLRKSGLKTFISQK